MASNSTITDTTLRLRDGRAMGVAQAGESGGFPIFHFHGSGSSRLEVDLLAPAAVSRGVRLIGLDRPGIGRSDPKPDARYGLLDWPEDVVDAADQLGVECFSVEGLSAGGPFALACAYKIPERLTGCGLISTVPPGSLMRKAGPGWMRFIWWMGEHFPGFYRSYLRLAVSDKATSVIDSEKELLSYARYMVEADRKLIRDPELRTGIARAFAENRRQGGQGERNTAAALIQPWGFALQEVGFERIFLWHGEEDRVMPVAPARLLAQELPHCTATFYPWEGHFSLVANHAGDIFDALMG